MEKETKKPLVSVIITVHNGQEFIDDCFEAIRNQTVAKNETATIEVCVFNDSSTDRTCDILNLWIEKFAEKQITLRIVHSQCTHPLGVGYGRNRSVEFSNGNYLCFQDIDDEMLPKRIEKQLEIASHHRNAIVGSKFIRTPLDATCRFTNWANNLNENQLNIQIFTAHGPTVIMPTWFCHRNVFRSVAGFSECGKGTPEDLLFFYKHLDLNGIVLRTNEVLLNYKYHKGATTFSIKEETIWNIRFQRLIDNVLNKSPWTNTFSIWNAGKQGRKFFRMLPQTIKDRVVSFCDVDANKINKTYNYFDEEKRKIQRSIPIVHFSKVHPPIVICMKLDLTHGSFENNLQSLNLVEDKDYILFS